MMSARAESKITAADIRSSGETDTGLVREENQDCIFVDQGQGLYAVFDGMGGHQGGATASLVARNTLVDVIARNRADYRTDKLLVKACKAAGAEVHRQAKANRELHGMGTTVVVLAMPQPNQAIIAHVGDSRAYLLRDQRLRRLTADHTIVAELVAAGRLTPEQAFDHPHASVLSRNLGGLPTTEVDLLKVELNVGDRLLLCSDGLNGYATRGAIEQVLSGAADPKAAVSDLIDLAKRGGGGDNVSTVVIDITKPSPDPSQDRGAKAWWNRRPLFMSACERMGMAGSPLVTQLPVTEALEFLAGSFCEAVYLDLNGTTGIHVWTYADSLVKAWFEREDDYQPIQELFDILRAAALSVVTDVAKTDNDFAVCLEISLLRALVVGEMVVGVQLSARLEERNEQFAIQSATSELPETTFANVATVPFTSLHSAMPAGPEVNHCLTQGTQAAMQTTGAHARPRLRAILDATLISASEFSGEAEMITTACELYGNRLLTEQEIDPIFDGLDACRSAHLAAIDDLDASPVVRGVALRALAGAHQSLFHAFALVAVDAGKPTTDALQEMNENTAQLRELLQRNERQLTKLEHALDTVEDFVHGDLTK